MWYNKEKFREGAGALLLFAAVGGDAHTLLGHALKSGYGLTAVPLMEYGPCGKPFFPDYPHIRFNLSHSGPYALCGVGESELGVDMEQIKPRSPALPRRVFSAAELDWYEAQGGDWLAFYTLWTRKESYCKQQGRGVARPRTVCPPLPGETAQLHSFSGPGWVASVCSDEQIPPIHWLDDEIS